MRVALTHEPRHLVPTCISVPLTSTFGQTNRRWQTSRATAAALSDGWARFYFPPRTDSPFSLLPRCRETNLATETMTVKKRLSLSLLPPREIATVTRKLWFLMWLERIEFFTRIDDPSTDGSVISNRLLFRFLKFAVFSGYDRVVNSFIGVYI